MVSHPVGPKTAFYHLLKQVTTRQIFRPPAQLALKSLQSCCLGSKSFRSKKFRGSLESKSKELLDICQDLKMEGYYPEGISQLQENSLLNEHIKHIFDKLSDDIIPKLALLAWHFKASSELPFKKLLEFFAHPEDSVDAVCQALNGRYSAYTERHMQWSKFGEEFVYDIGFLQSAMVGNRSLRGSHTWNRATRSLSSSIV